MDENGVVPIVPIVECIGIIDNNTAVSLMNAVNQHIYSTQNLSKVQIHFSSPGGELWASIALYNYIRSLPVPTRIVNIGAIGSAAVLIYLAADERFAAKNSIFMLHNLIYIFTPEIKNMEYSQMAFQMKSITDDTKAYIDIYNERTSERV